MILAAANLGLVLVVAGSSPIADVVSPLTGHLFGAGIAASVALVIRRNALGMTAIGVFFTICFHAWLGLGSCCDLDLRTRRTAALVPAGGSTGSQDFTVLALNAWHSHPDPQRLESFLAKSTADVVLLSEFGPDKSHILQSLKTIYPFQIDCAQRWACALALLSRVPLEAAGTSPSDSHKPAFIWARSGGVTFIGTHLYRPSRNPWRHQEHMRALVQFVRRLDGPLLLAGDLNTSPWSRSFRALKAGTGLSPATTLKPTWPVWPIPLPQIALDHIFTSPELRVTGAGTGPMVGSDHLPVWAHIEHRPIFDRGRSPLRRLALSFAAPCPHFRSEFFAHLAGEHGCPGDLSR